MRKNSLLLRGIAVVAVALLIYASFVPSISGYIGKIRDVFENIREQESFLGVSPEEEWNKTFGGVARDSGRSVQETTDGGYIITGYTESYGAGNGDVWLIKTDANGNEEWNKTFEGPGGMDFGTSIIQTSDGGYTITGCYSDYPPPPRDFIQDAWLIKTDANGDEQWNRTFGGTDHDIFESVQQTSDGGCIITGETRSYGAGKSDLWLIKTDINGIEQWNTTFGNSWNDHGMSLQLTSGGGYIITGVTQNISSYDLDVWLIKTDANGTELWNRTFGGDREDKAYSVEQTTDEGYIITGRTRSYGAGKSDLWLIKTDINGIEQWNKTFGGGDDDCGEAVIQTQDDGFIVTGFTGSFGEGEADVWLIKTNANGGIEWDRTFGGIYDDIGYSIQQTSDGGFVLTGYTEADWFDKDVWLIKIGPEDENQPPSVEIVNPREGYFHFSGIPLFPTALNMLADTASFGGFRLRPIQVNATDDNDESGELMVTLYIDDEDKGHGAWNAENGYHEWQWTGWALGTYRLMVRAKDVHGAVSEWAILDVWNFCFIL